MALASSSKIGRQETNDILDCSEEMLLLLEPETRVVDVAVPRKLL